MARKHAKWLKGSKHGNLELLENPKWNKEDDSKKALCRCNLCQKEYIINLTNFKRNNNCVDCRIKSNIGKVSKLRKGSTPDENGNKICSKCLVSQPKENYTVNNSNTDKLESFCKNCRRFKLLKETYNITVEDYNNMLDKQENKCFCCERHIDDLKKNLHVDHCHKTGKVRGLLCYNCNSALGSVRDSVEILKKMIIYLGDSINDY